MASVIYSEHPTHRANLQQAARVYQAATAGSPSQATVNAAEITFYRSCLASAIANGCNPSAFTESLRALGVTT